jgi:cytochrome c oxidase subunit IV
MAETKVLSPSEIAEEHQQEAHAPYLKVWLALAILTAVEYFYAAGFKDFFVILLGGLLVWAGIKAALVAWYFMHLKFEGNWVYLMIIPAIVLATVLVLALIPDQAMRPMDEVDEAAEGDVGFAPAGGATGRCPAVSVGLTLRSCDEVSRSLA